MSNEARFRFEKNLASSWIRTRHPVIEVRSANCSATLTLLHEVMNCSKTVHIYEKISLENVAINYIDIISFSRSLFQKREVMMLRVVLLAGVSFNVPLYSEKIHATL